MGKNKPSTQRAYYAEHKEQFVEYKRRYAEKYPEKLAKRDQDKYVRKLQSEGKDVGPLLERRERVEFLKDQPKWVGYAWRNHGYYIPWAIFKSIVPRLANGPCDICGKFGERMDLDHCHTKMVFRGTLCNACNTAIGNFQDSPTLLRKAADYLERDLNSPSTRVV